MYRGRVEIDSIQQAVTRLGLKMVRSLVVSLAMKQIFQATSDALDTQFQQIWDDSLQVAAISRMLAGGVAELENEQAMLGGLIHNIGALPILTKIDERWGYDADPNLISALIAELTPGLVGASSALELCRVPGQYPDRLLRPRLRPGPFPTYADIVLVARLQNLAAKGGAEAQAGWPISPLWQDRRRVGGRDHQYGRPGRRDRRGAQHVGGLIRSAPDLSPPGPDCNNPRHEFHFYRPGCPPCRLLLIETTPPLIAHVIYRLQVGGLENGVVNLVNRMPVDRYRHAIVCLTEATDFRQRIERSDVMVYEIHKRPGQDLGSWRRLYRLFPQHQTKRRPYPEYRLSRGADPGPAGRGTMPSAR